MQKLKIIELLSIHTEAFAHFGNCHYCTNLLKLFTQKPVAAEFGSKQKKKCAWHALG